MQTIKSELLTLRPIEASDTETLLAFRNNPRVRENFVYRKTLTREEHERWLKDEIETGNTLQWMMIVNGSPIGSVFVKNIHDDTPEYGIFIGDDNATGMGYASECADIVVSYCFANGLCERMGLRVYTDNIPAIRSYEHAGFKIVKKLPGVVATDGRTADMYWMETEAP